MKINVISDIHAVYDEKSKSVMYHLPFKYSEDKYLDAIDTMVEFWNNNAEMLKKIKIKPYVLYADTGMPVKTYTQMKKALIEFQNYAHNNFENVDYDKMMYFTRVLTIFDHHCYNNGFNWNYKGNKLTVYDIKNYMFKKLSDFDPTKLEPADYLIIAGDLGLDNTYDMILKDIEEKTKGKFKKILHIAGNHDHWWHGIEHMQQKRPDATNFTRDYSEWSDGEYLFLGCTLWTPIPDDKIWSVGHYMNDYNYTPGHFTPYVSRHQYELQSKWLKDKIKKNKDKKIIIFTHHQPFEELTLEDYKHNGKNWDGIDVNNAYVVIDHSLDNINQFGNIKLWCCGHTHQNYDGMLHGVHVVRNPIGYSDAYGKCPAENISGTWYNKIIEV